MNTVGKFQDPTGLQMKCIGFRPSSSAREFPIVIIIVFDRYFINYSEVLSSKVSSYTRNVEECLLSSPRLWFSAPFDV